ncbi:Uncharacterised protein [Mycobacteroides abscessus subsp. abscessus]|nr:Uncharacterised protein [Mycobacteroides abscessus subsp. abscessus]
MNWNRNSGYVGSRMSVRAAGAYDDGALPLSKITAAWLRDHEIGCTRAELRDLVEAGVPLTGEWHHTGKFFAETNFYRPEELREQIATLTPEQIAQARAAAKAARESRAVTKPVAKIYQLPKDPYVAGMEDARAALESGDLARIPEQGPASDVRRAANRAWAHDVTLPEKVVADPVGTYSRGWLVGAAQASHSCRALLENRLKVVAA